MLFLFYYLFCGLSRETLINANSEAEAEKEGKRQLAASCKKGSYKFVGVEPVDLSQIQVDF